MKKPLYKLGDIIEDPCTERKELIIAMRPFYSEYRYKTQYIDCPDKLSKCEAWCESTITDHYNVIGNLFDRGIL